MPDGRGTLVCHGVRKHELRIIPDLSFEPYRSAGHPEHWDQEKPSTAGLPLREEDGPGERRAMNRILRLAISAVAAALSANAYADSITIPARGAYIVDGDTVSYGGRNYRLHGIDAPEDGQIQYCNGAAIDLGDLSARALSSLISNRRITCDILDVDHYGRPIIRCRDRNGNDINEAMVRSGYAFAYARYSTDYVDAHEAARRENAGLWPLNPEMPWEYRERKR